MPAKHQPNTITPRCKWTNGGEEVLILKLVPKDGKTYRGFQWPLAVGAEVSSPNWAEDPNCESGGLFGWPWGFAVGDGRDLDYVNGTWLVFGALPQDVVDIGGKCKAKTGTIRFVGDWHSAFLFVLSGQMAYVHSGDSGSASNSGYSGSASNSGDRGSASNSGDSGSASTTAVGTAAISTGLCSKAKAAAHGCIALAWWNNLEKRQEMRCAEIGCGDGSDGKLKANAWYILNSEGQFIEVKND